MQEFALQLLSRQDNIDRNRREDRELRLAAVGSGWATMEDAFPAETVETVEAAVDLAEDTFTREGVEYDFSQVEWETPDRMDPQDLLDLEDFLSLTDVHVPTPNLDGEWA